MAESSAANATYPPLDTLKPVSDGLWIVDSGPLRTGGMPLPVRMTVVRLSGGELWLHSPTQFVPELKQELERLGPIKHLVAPDIGHWTFLQEWQRNCPEVTTWAAPGLRQRAVVRKSGVQLDHDLGERPPSAWVGDIEQIVVPGAAGFHEVAFFHRSSRTLVLTDLIVNLEAGKMPWLMRLFARLVGVVAPDGKAPIYLRALLRAKRREAAAAVTQMLVWNPEAVIFSHGTWFGGNGTAELKRSFRWLLRSGQR